MTGSLLRPRESRPVSTPGLRDEIVVVSLVAEDDMAGRLGDARDLADRQKWSVAALCIEESDATTDDQIANWIHHGADTVHVVRVPAGNQASAVEAVQSLWRTAAPRLVLTAADRTGRAWSARLAARAGWTLVSPALMIRTRERRLVAIRLDGTGERACTVELPQVQPAIVALRPGVAQPLPADRARTGTITRDRCRSDAPGRILSIEKFSAAPESTDIRHLPKLISGGRGVGSKEGFDRLRRIGAKLGAGVAASRMAVDLGWIEHDRQVGQTGKRVTPELYIACGISGASHHLEGMSASGQIVAINLDERAPLMQKAHLAIQGDLHRVLEELDHLLEQTV